MISLYWIWNGPQIVGPIKLQCMIMFDITKIKPKSIISPVKFPKVFVVSAIKICMCACIYVCRGLPNWWTLSMTRKCCLHRHGMLIITVMADRNQETRHKVWSWFIQAWKVNLALKSHWIWCWSGKITFCLEKLLTISWSHWKISVSRSWIVFIFDVYPVSPNNDL